MSGNAKFTPNIIGIICNWCCYGGADLCGVSRFQYPPYIRLIRVMCSGRVDLSHVFQAFLHGADAMFVGGCHLDDCHYITHGNYEALSMVRLAQKILGRLGVDPRRLRIEWVSAGEGIRFSNIMNEFGKEIKELGPLGQSEGLDPAALRTGLEEVIRLIPYIKLAKKDKLALHLKKEEEYRTLYSDAEVAALFEETVSYCIDPEKCQACMACLRRCPAEAIEGGKNTIHVIDQDKCLKCGICLEACPSRFGAVQKISGGPVPSPIPPGDRAVIRESKSRATADRG